MVHSTKKGLFSLSVHAEECGHDIFFCLVILLHIKLSCSKLSYRTNAVIPFWFFVSWHKTKSIHATPIHFTIAFVLCMYLCVFICNVNHAVSLYSVTNSDIVDARVNLFSRLQSLCSTRCNTCRSESNFNKRVARHERPR